MHRIGTVSLLVALATTTACIDQEVTPLEPEFDAAFSVGGGGLATYEVTIENLTSGQPFTPPLAVTHRRGLERVFEVGEEASLGVQEIAENGNLPPLVGVLGPDPKVLELVIALPTDPMAPPPILPGASRTFTITADRRARFFSFVSMLICTNDGFTGVSRMRLPRDDDDPSVRTLVAYDAGTEINTEMFADMVPPCGPLTDTGPLTGTDMTDPALEEMGGVIHMHAGIVGDGDLSIDPHGWTNPVARLSITLLDKSDKSEKSEKSDKR